MKTLLTTAAVLLVLTTAANAHHNERTDEDIKYMDLQICAIDAEVIDIAYVTGRSTGEVREILAVPNAGSLRSAVTRLAYDKAALIRDGYHKGLDLVQVMNSVVRNQEAYNSQITKCLIDYARP